MAGPAVGVEPVWPVPTVATVNDAVPASADSVPISSPATAQRLSRPADTASTSAPSVPPTSMVQASQVSQPLASLRIRHEAPDGRAGDHDRERHPGDVVLAPQPQHAAADRDQCGEGRGQGHRVVRVDGAGHEGEDEPGHDQPAAPEQQGRARPVQPWGVPGGDEARDEGDQRGGEQPGDLGGELAVEHPQDACGATEPGTAATAAATAGAAEDPAEAVVADRQLPQRVVRRAADVGRADAGHSSTSATNQPAATTRAPVAARRWPIRARSRSGEATR